MRALNLVAGLALAAALVGCSDDGDGGNASDGEKKPKAAAAAKTPEILRSGFGQRDEYVQAIVVVKNTDKASVGEYVTASVNFKDASGNLVATETQVEHFSWVNQELVLPVWLDLSSQPKTDIATIEPTVTISDHGSAADPAEPLAPVDASTIGENMYGGPSAKFTLSNAGSEPLEELRVGIVCEDASGAIVGGSSDYPDLIPAGGEILLDADVTTTGMPAKCTAYPNYGDV